VTEDVAARACGNAARLEDGVCTPRPCAPDMVFDESSDTCIPLQSVRQIATSQLFSLDAEEHIGCPEDATLHVARGKARCTPATACVRGQFRIDEEARADAKADAAADARADANADAAANANANANAHAKADAGAAAVCEAPPPCPSGSFAGSVHPHDCETFFTTTGSVDAATWLRLVVGPDGSLGTRWVCEPLEALSARLFDSAGATVPVSVQLDVPGNDVTQVAVTVAVEGPPEANALVEKSVRPLAEAFRSLGGTSTTTQASVKVLCALPASPRPIRVRPPASDAGAPP
jgi:hypothetical protein